jgi:hypothetical protein
MKALISAFALFAFLAGTTLPIESYAQATGGQTMAPDTTATTPPAATKKKKTSKTHHVKKKSKKSSAMQSSSVKHKRAGHSAG